MRPYPLHFYIAFTEAQSGPATDQWGGTVPPKMSPNKIDSFFNDYYSEDDIASVHDRSGFTLIELLTVIAIIAILASIALPVWVQYRTRGFDRTAHVDLKNAYTAAQGYFTSYPLATISLPKLENFGFRKSKNIDLQVVDGEVNTLKMKAEHLKGETMYSLNASGRIVETPK